MENLRNYVNGEIIMESINDMMLSQDPKDRMHYNDIAMEAIMSPVGKSKLIQQLYTDIIAKSNIDYGKIPLSKGDLTAYAYYDPMYKSIDTLNLLFGDESNDDLKLTNDLHNMIITSRVDFEFGFKFDIEIIKIMYNLLVMSLYEMINICIVDYTNYLKDIKGVEFTFKMTKKKDLVILKFVKDFMKSYKSGEFTKMMLSFKKNPSNFLGTMMAAAGASAAVITATHVALAVLGTFVIVRLAIYYFYHLSFKFNDYIKTQGEFLKYYIEYSSDNNSTSLQKQKNFLGKLTNLSDSIETKILKTNMKASEALQKSNKENYNPGELSTPDYSII